MSRAPGLPAVLIVDEDLGFLGWLGEIFNEAGYRALPAINCRQAISLIKRFKLQVDVIAVNERLPGVSSMIVMLRRSHRPLRIVAIHAPGDATGTIAAHASLERPSGWDPISRLDWVRKVLRAVKQADARAAV